MLTQVETANQKRLAIAVVPKGGVQFPALITVLQVDNASKPIAGFRFDPQRQHRTGDIINNEDGSTATVVCIINSIEPREPKESRQP